MQSTQHGTCTVDGCERKSSDNGYCPAHAQRVRRNGDPGSAEIRQAQRKPKRPCSVEGCTADAYCKGMCTQHYQRVRQHGDPLVASTPGAVRVIGATAQGWQHHNWQGDDVGYRAVHTRLVKQRGSAADRPCTDCGGTASQWSYDNADPNEKLDPAYGAFSTDLDRYYPRCRRCHHAYDCRTSSTHVHNDRLCFHTAA